MLWLRVRNESEILNATVQDVGSMRSEIMEVRWAIEWQRRARINARRAVRQLC